MGWQLDIADSCMNAGLELMRHAGWAALMIAFSYFEMIAKMKAGYVGEKSESKNYFERGVLDVFPGLAEVPEALKTDILRILYRSARCGFYHGGMAGGRIIISGEYKQPLAFRADSRYVLINPHLLIPELKAHFTKYIECLRDPGNKQGRDNFEKRFDYLRNWDPLRERLA